MDKESVSGLGVVVVVEMRVHLMSYCLCVAQQTFVYQILVFPSPCELPSSPLKSQTTTRNILFLSLAKDGISCWLSGKESTCNAGDAGDMGSIPESGRSCLRKNRE